MTASVVRVTFKKMVSDGDYGHEAAECTLEYALENGEEPTSFAETLFEQARHRVHMELAKSPSMAVRRRIAPPEPPRALASIGAAEDVDLEDLPFADP